MKFERRKDMNTWIFKIENPELMKTEKQKDNLDLENPLAFFLVQNKTIY